MTSSAFQVYASRFLAGDNQQIFRTSPPTSPDPFVHSPTTHLPGSSPSETPPFPGIGIDDIPEIPTTLPSVPNPYAGSSSSEEDVSGKGIARPPQRGWIAHQSVFPPSSISSASEYAVYDDENEGYAEEQYIPDTSIGEPLVNHPSHTPGRLQVYHNNFGHWEREGLRKYKDAGYLALWLSSIMGILLGLCFVWGSTDAPIEAPRRPSIIPILPLLFVLIIPAIILPPLFLYLLQKTVRPVLTATAIAIPFSLFICGWWALAASFERFDAPDAWWGTTGLRICAVLIWVVSGWFAWLMWARRQRLKQTAAVVELSTKLLLSHPPLLLLTPLLLSTFAVLSIPFLIMLVRLGTIGYWRHPRENTWVYHIRPYAGWLIFLVTVIWLWSWSVIRGIGRVAVAAVIGQWYFHRHEPDHPKPLEITVAAVHRATGTSLGSICLGAGIVAVSRVIGKSAAKLKNLASKSLSFMSPIAPVFSVIAGVLDQLNGFALIYVGITGEAFWPSARRAVGLAGRKKRGQLLDYTLIKLLLTLSSTATGLFTGTAGYLYMSHSLVNPSYAPAAALLCGGVPFMAIRAGAAVLGDAADALFICHQIDNETGGQSCSQAKEAFSVERDLYSA